MNEQDDLKFSNLSRESKILSEIQQTLAVNPNATQRTMAQNSNVSLGMMNAILKRCMERGWIAVKNLNMKKVCYYLTPEGFSEVSKRSSNYMKHSFSMMNDYADKILEIINEAKLEGKNKVCLYGNSNVRFVIEWACQKNDILFEQYSENDKIESENSLNFAGEQLDESVIQMLLKNGCKSIYDVVK